MAIPLFNAEVNIVAAGNTVLLPANNYSISAMAIFIRLLDGAAFGSANLLVFPTSGGTLFSFNINMAAAGPAFPNVAFSLPFSSNVIIKSGDGISVNTVFNGGVNRVVPTFNIYGEKLL